MNLIAGLTAFFLGALHALEPGHGKSAIAAYAVGYRSSFRHILVLGLSTAVAHTATILVLSLILGAAVSAVADQKRAAVDRNRQCVFNFGNGRVALAAGAAKP